MSATVADVLCRECQELLVVTPSRFLACPRGNGKLVAMPDNYPMLARQHKQTQAMNSLPKLMECETIAGKKKYKIEGFDGWYTRTRLRKQLPPVAVLAINSQGQVRAFIRER